MSQLIIIRRRIKAIQTIKKITNAMKLVSRSLHNQMNNKQHSLKNNTLSIENILHKYCSSISVAHSRLFPHYDTEEQKLTILVGSQKGLCGTYNAPLNYWLSTHAPLFKKNSHTIIVIGKKMQELVARYNIKPLFIIDEVKLSTIDHISKHLLTHIMESSKPYTHVSFISNHKKNFFSRILKETAIIPLTYNTNPLTPKDHQDRGFTWLNSNQDVIFKLSSMLAKNYIHTILFEALMSEQAARFVAMDNATRSANQLLESMKIQYNKLRQTKITKELIELTGSLKK